MNFIGLIFIMLVKGNAQDVPNDKETNRGEWEDEKYSGGGGGGGYATEKKNRGGRKTKNKGAGVCH